MLRVALTGGIGCGKSTVCRLFTDWGAPIIDADVIARQLVEPGQAALQTIVDYFGRDILDEQGGLQRAALRARIFVHPEDKQVLESILHPLIYAEIEARVAVLQASYALIAVPLLVETGQISAFDRLLLVDCPESLQKQRVMSRDDVDEAQASAIIASQASREARLAVAHDVIDNSQALDHLAEQVKKLHNFYLFLATTRKS